jgi:hypothetical protein
MTQKAKHARLLAASTICVLGALTLPVGAEMRDGTIQLAASDSYWCRMFPKFCGDEGTPGGTQNAPDMAPEGAARGLEPAQPAAETAAPAAPAAGTEEPEKPADPPPAAQ